MAQTKTFALWTALTTSTPALTTPSAFPAIKCATWSQIVSTAQMRQGAASAAEMVLNASVLNFTAMEWHIVKTLLTSWTAPRPTTLQISFTRVCQMIAYNFGVINSSMLSNRFNKS